MAVWDFSMGLLWWSPQHTWEDSERRADVPGFFTLYVSLSFHCRFTLIFSHVRHIDAIDVHWCLSCLHGLALRSPGSWLGGSRVSALRLFFAWHLSVHPVMLMALSFCYFDGWPAQDGAHKLPGHYVSCVASLYFHSTAWLCCSFWVFVFVGCAVFVWLVLFLVFLVFAFFVPCGMTSYDLTPRVSEAVTASASLAVIKTASKHLHNDLARAIEALEQNYTPVDPKQFFHIHVVILAPDVGNFESISMGNSMNYKQHVFMYYCYLGDLCWCNTWEKKKTRREKRTEIED